jgi:isoleucyl-tRNA synthetase
MPLAADAIAALDPTHVAAALGEDASGPAVGITVDGREHTLSSDEVILTMRPPEGYSVEREGAHAVALDLAIDEELREEGYAREIVHAVQGARKAAGLEVEDRIELALDGDAALTAAATAYRDYVTGETLATGFDVGDGATSSVVEYGYSDDVQVEGLTLKISLRKA